MCIYMCVCTVRSTTRGVCAVRRWVFANPIVLGDQIRFLAIKHVSGLAADAAKAFGNRISPGNPIRFWLYIYR